MIQRIKQIFITLLFVASMQTTTMNAENGWRSMIGSVLTSPKTWVIGSGIGTLVSTGFMKYFSRQMQSCATAMRNAHSYQQNVQPALVNNDLTAINQARTQVSQAGAAYTRALSRKNNAMCLSSLFVGAFVTSLAWLKWGGKRA